MNSFAPGVWLFITQKLKGDMCEQLTPNHFAEMAVGQMALSDSGALSIRAIVPSRPVANRCGIGVNFKRLESRCMEVSSVALEMQTFGIPPVCFQGIPHNVVF